MGKLTSWLLVEESKEGVIPALDKFIIFLLKIIYLALRFSLRLILGRKKRDKLYYERNIHFNSYIYPSFTLFQLFYKCIRFLRLGNPNFLKISVPKYDYKYYCRISSKSDFTPRREEGIIEKFCPKEGDTVIDIGAHIGHYTIISSKRVGPNGKVVAIEAHPDNFKMLVHNIELNKLTNVMALNSTVYSQQQSKIKLYVPGEGSGFTTYNTINSKRDKIDEKFVEVNAHTLDYLLYLKGISEEKEVNWIKIDVEGAEFEVLKGARNVLSKNKDIAILIEIHNLHGDDGSNSTNLYEPIIKFLSSYNFKIEFEKTYESGEKHIIVRK